MIREMNKNDWESVSKIYKQGIESGIATFTPKCPEYDEWDKAHLKVCRFVYEDDGEVQGFIVLSPVSAREVYRGVVEVSIYVAENCHRKGIGSALIEHMKKEAKKAGFWTLFSSALAVNKGSIAMHKKCGFREIGYRERIAKDIFGNWQNSIIMEYRM